MVWLWRFLIGYLTIKINGEYGEQILNRAAANGISIWNLHYKNGCISGNISAQNFCKLRTLKRGIKCKIKIVKKHGYIFRIKKYKKRVGFVSGVAIFSAILVFLSNFVWIINVEGNSNLSTKEIISSCKKIGIYEGMRKKKVNNKYDSQRLQLLQSGIAWCSLNLEGSVLTVNLSETAISDKEQRQNPSNLKAAFEGKIKKIDITSGDAVIKVGDTVSKGDLLVSGVKQNLSSTLFVHSEGVVIAETKRTFSAEGEFTQTTQQMTGDIIKRFTIDFFNLKIPLYLGNIKQQHSYHANIKNLTIFDKEIPIKIACEKYDICKETTVLHEKSVLEEMLYTDIKNQVKGFEFLNATEGEKEFTYTDKGILLKITYICEENIAVQDKILLDTEN